MPHVIPVSMRRAVDLPEEACVLCGSQSLSSGQLRPMAALNWKSVGLLAVTSCCSFCSTVSSTFWLMPHDRDDLSMIVAAVSPLAPS